MKIYKSSFSNFYWTLLYCKQKLVHYITHDFAIDIHVCFKKYICTVSDVELKLLLNPNSEWSAIGESKPTLKFTVISFVSVCFSQTHMHWNMIWIKKKSLFALNFNFQFSIFVNSDTISYFTIYTKESV